METEALVEQLDRRLRRLPFGPLAVGWSGGMDSTVLVHLLAQLPEARARGLRALHVDHRLDPASTSWAEHCRLVATRLDLPLEIVVVNVPATADLENAARRARYAAFAARLRPGEILALAHHADDQAETVLLKLLRAAGPEGLGGMRRLRPFAAGQVWRPLLDCDRSALAAYARAHALHWIEDPSNADTRRDRNFLRHVILPALQLRWPQARRALGHSARWARAAAEYLRDEAATTLARLRGTDPSTLAWQPWLALPPALRDPVLRLWLRELGQPEPSFGQLAELEHQLRHAAADRAASVRYAGVELRRYRQYLFVLAAQPPVPSDWEARWDGRPLALPAGGTLTLTPATVLAEPLRVTYRRGGERLCLAGGRHRRALRVLLQEAGIPPWQRGRLPLIHAGTELLAVGDRWLSEAGRRWCDAHGVRFVLDPAASSPPRLTRH